jgi:hypothetical protein
VCQAGLWHQPRRLRVPDALYRIVVTDHQPNVRSYCRPETLTVPDLGRQYRAMRMRILLALTAVLARLYFGGNAPDPAIFADK